MAAAGARRAEPGDVNQLSRPVTEPCGRDQSQWLSSLQPGCVLVWVGQWRVLGIVEPVHDLVIAGGRGHPPEDLDPGFSRKPARLGDDPLMNVRQDFVPWLDPPRHARRNGRLVVRQLQTGYPRSSPLSSLLLTLELQPPNRVPVRVDEPGGERKPDVRDAVDGLQTGFVELLHLDAARPQLGCLGSQILDSPGGLRLRFAGPFVLRVTTSRLSPPHLNVRKA